MEAIRSPDPAHRTRDAHGQDAASRDASAVPDALATPEAIAARLDRLPATRYVWQIVILLSLGGCFEFYDLFMTGYIAPGLIGSGLFAKSTTSVFAMNSIAAFVAATFLGLFIGTLGLSFLADRYGRRRVFVWALIGYTAATVAMAFQHSAAGVNLFRLLAGLGLGLEMVTINTYVAELMPKDLRGRAFAVTQVIPYCAVPTVALMSWWLVPLRPLGLDGWRWVALASALGALVIWTLRLGIPESPRWLLSRARVAEADAVTRGIEAIVARQYGAPLPAPRGVEAPAARTAPPASRARQTSGNASFAVILQAPYRTRTVMMSLFNAISVIGFYGFSNWIPSLLSAKGFSLVHSLQYSFLMSVALPLGPLLFLYFADKVERKWSLVAACGAIALLGMVLAAQTTAPGVVVFGFFLNLTLPIMTYSFQAYQSELYPTEVRARAIGFVYSWSRLSAIFSGFLVAFFLRDFGTHGVFVMISSSMVLSMLLIGVLGPNTRGRSLEEIDA
ncbi:MFS transporter [Robbsia sp. Bb-Pol-6]|uniref:MFS transporter n=1 Tax=Robbsia betulipollinis TaxID=2981849 RepID=A0ABT3ZHS2_9BURK|nr:MFS transporter [Robbsia betulipollinis]MCY0386076.1 MFS transporter [Robbsia betulipollinis]